ncbi:hypothetical protein [Arthrobacter sp. YN]
MGMAGVRIGWTVTSNAAATEKLLNYVLHNSRYQRPQ